MGAVARFVAASCLALAVAGTPVRAEDVPQTAQAQGAPPAVPVDAARPSHADVPHPAHNPAEHACLNQKDRRAAIESGKIIRLSAAMHAVKRRMPGAVVRARLCQGHDGLVYVLTVLAHDGRVARINVDAAKGTFAGEH